MSSVEKNLIRTSTLLALEVLDSSKHSNERKHKLFMAQESLNVLFLISRIPGQRAIINRSMKKCSIPTNDSTGWHIYAYLGKKHYAKPTYRTYENEFPEYVLSGPCLMIATRIFVAEALLSVTFDTTRLCGIMNVALARLRNENTNLKFQKSNKLTSKSQYLVYFVTHIVLLATFWGTYRVNNMLAKWKQVKKTLWHFVDNIKHAQKENLEVWLELVICLHLLNETTNLYPIIQSTLSHFEERPFKKSTNPHTHYHTYALWAFYFAFVAQFLHCDVSNAQRMWTTNSQNLHMVSWS